jgi:hypothetical protein
MSVTLSIVDAATAETIRIVPLSEPPGIRRWGELQAIMDPERQAQRLLLVGVDNLSSDAPTAWVHRFRRKAGGA